MGGCLGGAAGPHKEPEDLTLDELEFEKVKIQQFDDVFNAAAEVLNVVVDLNNDIVSTVDMMKDAVADLLGSHAVHISTDEEGHIKFALTEQDTHGEQKPMAPAKATEFLTAKVELKRAYDACVPLCTNMNKAVGATESLLTVTVKKGRVVATVAESKEEEHEAKIKAAKRSVEAFNNKMFKVKFELMKLAAAEAMEPAKAIKHFIVELKTHVKGFVPSINCNLAGIMEGNIDFHMPELPTDLMSALPAKLRRAYDAVMGPEGLVETVKAAVAKVQSIVEKGEALKSAAEALPQEPDAIQSAITDANLDAMFALKVPLRITANIKTVASVPNVVKGFIETIKKIVMDVKAGVEAAIAAA